MVSAPDRVQLFMTLAVVLYRASHLAVGVFAVTQMQQDRPHLSVLLGLAITLSAACYGAVLLRGSLSRLCAYVDVLVLGCLAPFAEHAWDAGAPVMAGDWVMLLGTSASAMAAIAFEPWVLVGAELLLVASHVAVYRLADAGSGPIGGHVISLVSSAALARALWWWLHREKRLLEEANARTVAAEAQRARYAERLEQYRALHDTVLATLTAIAGGVDAGAPHVRERCAREAAYLRRLIQRTSQEQVPAQLGAALEEAVASAEMLGLRVTAQYHRMPDLPCEVAAALADAVREALNNVQRHAGTGHAYLTVTGRDDGLVLTVVDRGRGYDPDVVPPGLGLSRSVLGRMEHIGGSALVDTAPEEGVRLELRWPR